MFEVGGKAVDLDFVPNTDEQLAGARRFVEARCSASDEALEVLQMLGMEPYVRQVSINGVGPLQPVLSA